MRILVTKKTAKLLKTILLLSVSALLLILYWLMSISQEIKYYLNNEDKHIDPYHDTKTKTAREIPISVSNDEYPFNAYKIELQKCIDECHNMSGLLCDENDSY